MFAGRPCPCHHVARISRWAETGLSHNLVSHCHGPQSQPDQDRIWLRCAACADQACGGRTIPPIRERDRTLDRAPLGPAGNVTENQRQQCAGRENKVMHRSENGNSMFSTHQGDGIKERFYSMQRAHTVRSLIVCTCTSASISLSAPVQDFSVIRALLFT